MSYLVAGADRVDAGKTTFAVGLLHRLGAVGFKPRAGNDYWFDHDDYRRAAADGRLYGSDARRLAAAGAADARPEALNPVHRLWRPISGTGDVVGQAGREFLVDRVGGTFVVNGTATLPDDVAESLPLDDAERVDSLEALNRLTRERYLPELDALAARIAETEDAVVESYGDVARPVRDLVVDRVAVVGPGRVRVYDGERFARACEVAGGRPTDGQLEERVPDVVEHVEPEASVAIPALPAAARDSPERVAAAYAPAYEALV